MKNKIKKYNKEQRNTKLSETLYQRERQTERGRERDQPGLITERSNIKK